MKSILVLAAAIPSIAAAQVPMGPVQTITGTRLDVVARGEVRRVPDLAVISAGVVTQARDARTALASNSTRMARVLTALRGAGVAERDISTSQISLQAQYRYGDNIPPVITGYQANNSVSIRFRDVAKSGAILDALVAEGANQINGPTLTIDKPEAAQDEARVDAMRIARARADLYARAAGLSVKRIVSISESGDFGGGPPIIMQMARDSAASKTEIVPGEQAVGATVSVTFELN